MEFYSPGKTEILRNKIATFAQAPTETIAEAYERFNDYIRAVPHHKFSREDVVQKFYQGLTTASRGIIDASAGGSIIELTPTQVFKLFKKANFGVAHCRNMYFAGAHRQLQYWLSTITKTGSLAVAHHLH